MDKVSAKMGQTFKKGRTWEPERKLEQEMSSEEEKLQPKHRNQKGKGLLLYSFFSEHKCFLTQFEIQLDHGY